jgi:hypothetical protein
MKNEHQELLAAPPSGGSAGPFRGGAYMEAL